MRAPTIVELTGLARTLARRVARFLERQRLLEPDAENSYLIGEGLEAGPVDQLLAYRSTYCIAVGTLQGSKEFILRTLPGCDASFDDDVGEVAEFPLHSGGSGESR